MNIGEEGFTQVEEKDGTLFNQIMQNGIEKGIGKEKQREADYVIKCKENFDNGSECAHVKYNETDKLKQEDKLQLVGFHAAVDIHTNSSKEEVKPKVENSKCSSADKQEYSIIKLIDSDVIVKQEEFVDSPEYLPINEDFLGSQIGQTKTEDDIDIFYDNIKIEKIKAEPVDNEDCLNSGYCSHLYYPIQVDEKNEAPFQCKVCSATFSTEYNFTKHLLIHSKETQCKFCSKSFKHHRNLVRHERTHTEEKPFDCKNCSKQFSYRHNLVQHERIHTGEKPFDCKICLKSFTARSTLVRHERIHAGDKQIKSNQIKLYFIVEDRISLTKC